MTIKPPSLKVICIANLALAALLIAMVIWQGPTWLSVLDAAVAGFNIAAAISGWHMEQMHQHFERMRLLMIELHVLNEQLLQNKIQFIAAAGGIEHDGATPSTSIH